MQPGDIQEEEYEFPYHHLVTIRPFSETRNLFWGFMYAAYLEKVLSSLQQFSFESLIEIGCGDGKVLKEIARAFPGKKYVGTDYSERSLRFARAFSPDIEFSKDSQDKFDGFILVEVLEHIPPESMPNFLDEICSKLKDNAFGIITTPCDNTPVSPKHYQHFNRDSIERTLGTHFHIESFEYTMADTFGIWIVRRLLANKFFILNYAPLVGWIYRFYKKNYLSASRDNARQVFVIVKKK